MRCPRRSSVFQAEGLGTDVQQNTACCYAVQDKVWVQGPDIAWEIYTVLGDAPDMACMPIGCAMSDDAPLPLASTASAACC